MTATMNEHISERFPAKLVSHERNISLKKNLVAFFGIGHMFRGVISVL